MSANPFEHGQWNCQSDAYENSPFYSVGGLQARGELQRPSWISEGNWPEYRRGYEDMARRMFGLEWRTVPFGWAPTITLTDKATPMSTTITLPSITGVLTVAQTDSGHVVTVTIEPGPTNRTWSASCKFASAPEGDVLDNAARRMLVNAMQKWLMEGGHVHLVLSVEGLDEAIGVEPPCTTTSLTSSPSSTDSTTSDAGSAGYSTTSTG